MATRPWVAPEEVIAYTDYAQVQNRSEAKLAIDISRAEAYVVAYTNNTFADYEEIPEAVKTAVILLAEAYAYNACADMQTGGRRLKSETFDDYSYTSDDAYIDIDGLYADIKILLDPYILVKARNGITMRMRRL